MTSQTAPSFDDAMAGQIWTAYFRDVDRRLRPLSAGHRDEIRDELVAHVLDGFDAETDGSEAERLDRVLRRMGPPGDYLDRFLTDADATSETSARWRVVRGLRDIGGKLALGACYLLGLVSLLFALAKPLWPEHVGLYRMPTGWWIVGYVDSAGSVEYLGYWLIPVMLLFVVVFWFILPRRLSRRR